MMIETEIDQNESDDIIYDLSKMPNWIAIPYVKGGLYDRIQENISKHSDTPLLVDQDEYQWFRRPSMSMGYLPNLTSLVKLLKPGATLASVILSDDKYKFILSIHLAYYDSAVNISTHAVTWVTPTSVLKPLKILKHRWEKIKWHSDVSRYKCTNCGMLGSGKFFTSNSMRVKSAICPDRLLTCNQEIIREVIT